MHIEAETDERIDERQDEKEARIADRTDEIERHVGLPARPVRSHDQHGDQHQKGEGGPPFGAGELNRYRFAEADDQGPGEGAGRAADAAEDGGCEQRQQQIEAHEGADLHERARA